MSTPNPPNSSVEFDDYLLQLTHSTALAAERFISTVTEVATGANPDAAISLLILALGELTRAGVHIGAVVDVVPRDQFEPDAGPEPDLDGMRRSLANLLDGVDDYHQVEDPLLSAQTSAERISDDLTLITSQLGTGMAHYHRGEFSEALWWWQYSYLAVWGDRAASVLRVLLSMLTHIRLDISSEAAGEAAFDALHSSQEQPGPQEG